MNPSDSQGEAIRIDDLRNLVSELRMMARQFLTTESHKHSFTPTALAMTALRRIKLREQDWEEVRWENRAHFFAAIATAMRHALIDYARRRRAKGRDTVIYLPPDEILFRDLPSDAEDRPERIVLLEESIARLASENKRLADVVHQFYYLGYSTEEMGRVSGMSEKTVDRDLKKARIILRKMMEDSMKG